MQKITRYFKVLVFVAILIGILAFVVGNYEYVFSKTIIGQVTGIDRVSNPTAILGSAAATSEALFSFAVALKDKNGEFFTASTEDRQWAVVKQGDCAEVIFYPYPPWDLKSAGTYHNARLKKLLTCDANTGGNVSKPASTEAVSEAHHQAPSPSLAPGATATVATPSSGAEGKTSR